MPVNRVSKEMVREDASSLVISIMKVYVGGWVQFCVDIDTKLGHHCDKGEYVCEEFIIKKL